MKQSILLAAPFIAASLTPVTGYCASALTTAHVLSFGNYANGNAYVELDTQIVQSGCPYADPRYIELPADAIVGKSVLAMATLALSMEAPVIIQTDACLNGLPSFSGARSGFFGVKKP